LHRQWFGQTALADLLSEDEVIAKDILYRCLDRLLRHKKDFFTFLTERWHSLFEANFDVLLYDLTSTYFECVPPDEGKRRFGYSRDKRSERAGGHCLDRHPRRVSVGLRSDAGQYQ
jgi:hypothetical protein